MTSRLRRFAAQPLLHFLVLGGLPFALWPGGGEPRQVVEQSDQERLVREARALGLHHTDPVVRRRLVRNLRFVLPDDPRSDDALFAEALALGMDRTDRVVRRRLAQRVALAVQAAARTPEPSEAELQAYLVRRAERFRLPERVQLTQLFLSRERRGARLEPDARALLASLRARDAGPEVAAGLADPLPLPVDPSSSSSDELTRHVGPGFAEAVTPLPEAQWVGPVASSYGLHLVWIHERSPARLPALASVRGAVRESLLAERGEVALARALAEAWP